MPIPVQSQVMQTPAPPSSGKGPNLLSFIVAAATQNWPAAATALTGSPLAGMAVGGMQAASQTATPGEAGNPSASGSTQKEKPPPSPDLEKKQDPSGQGLPNQVGQPQGQAALSPGAVANLQQSQVPQGGMPQAPMPFGFNPMMGMGFGSGFSPPMQQFQWWNRR